MAPDDLGDVDTIALGDLLGDGFDAFAERLAESGREVSRDEQIESWESVRGKLIAAGFGSVPDAVRDELHSNKVGLGEDETPTDEWLLEVAGLGRLDPATIEPWRLEEARTQALSLNDEIRLHVDAYCDTLSYHLHNKLVSDRIPRWPLFADRDTAPIGGEVDREKSAVYGKAGATDGQWFYSLSVYKSDDPLIEQSLLGIRQARSERWTALRSILDPSDD